MLPSQTPSARFRLASDLMGPRTLRQKIQGMEIAKQVTERVSYGNGFIEPGTLTRQKEEISELHARMELILEVHPELAEMNKRHMELGIQLGSATQKDIDEIGAECADLARQIVEIENSVDLG